MSGVGETPSLPVQYPQNCPQASPSSFYPVEVSCGHCVPSLQTHPDLGWTLKAVILEGRENTSLNHSVLQMAASLQLGIFPGVLFLRLILFF